MDNVRLLLVVGLATVSLLMWEAWQRDYGPGAVGPAPAAEQAPAAADDADAPPVGPAAAEAGPPVVAAPAPEPGDGVAAPAGADLVTVRTDVLDIEVDLDGGTIVRAALPAYPVSIDRPDEPFVLLDHSPELFFVLQSGLAGDDAPDHRTRLEAARRHFELDPGAETLEVPLTWRSDGGLEVQKVLRLKRGSYVVEVLYRIRNSGSQPWQGRIYGQLQRRHEDRRGGLTALPTFVGAALSSPEKRYQKFRFDDLQEQPIDQEITGGWVAILQHYFLAALVPPADEPFHYYSRVLDGGRYLVGAYGPAIRLAPGEEREVGLVTFIGPKLQHVLAEIAPGLDLTVDYGWLWFIAKPLYWVLEHLHGLTGNWGVAIILVTVLLKLLFFPLSAMGYRSMARMRKVQPRMMALRERFKDDRQRLNQAMMELYRSERINPFGGCLPILVQIPFFIALYWVLLESVELRQAPFFGWIRDLSTRDPYFVLPLIMGISMWFQQRLNPAPTDPVQQQVMKVLPIVFTVFFAFFPSGLVLYWVVNNILSIGQQWVITRRIEAED